MFVAFRGRNVELATDFRSDDPLREGRKPVGSCRSESSVEIDNPLGVGAAQGPDDQAAIPENPTLQPFANPRTGTMLSVTFLSSLCRSAGPSVLRPDFRGQGPSLHHRHTRARQRHPLAESYPVPPCLYASSGDYLVVSPALSSAYSHAFATVQSRPTVAGEIFSASAVSSIVSPPK